VRKQVSRRNFLGTLAAGALAGTPALQARPASAMQSSPSASNMAALLGRHTRPHDALSLLATGCFSFQASKNLNSGEGGAILTDDEALLENCYRFHSNSRGRKNTGNDFSYRNTGANLRMTEFQAGLLLAQMTRLEAQARTRDQNAAYLTSRVRETVVCSAASSRQRPELLQPRAP
jgi:dTDP-4-amino-4,6-dideoxygalactose transaminase